MHTTSEIWSAIISRMEFAIQRADHALAKLTALAAEIETYIASVEIESECTITPDRDGYLVHSFLRPPPPATWKLVVSEVIHHQRSALDNAAWHLANMAGPPSDPRAIAFPVVHQEEKWNSAARRNLAGVPQVAVDLIRSVQPFVDSTDSKASWLALLQHFSNQDKHAELLRVNLFSFGTSHKADIKYRDQPTAPERIERLYYGEDGVAAFVRTGGHILSVQGSVEGKVDLVLVGPEGDPFKLINCLANLSISVRAMVDELSRMAGPQHDEQASVTA
jgi:hypothetical protein